ncbi:MAG: hypothetical protein JXA90_13250, partial [Planctomycetes bacterium]|nr:hypothetical protein [Planctomycetota bacterium]
MALDDKAKNREARIRAYEVTGEWQIRSSLQQDLNRFRRRGEDIPDGLDEEVILRVAAILRKATQPQSHIWLVRQLYETTKDFRLLEALPEAVIGQTAAKIYPYLQSLEEVIGQIGDEATADLLEKHLAGLRGKAGTDVDRRALFLLEFLVERRAADQANGAGPHVQAALGALEAAMKGAWTEGEPVLMARYLASVGGLVPPLREVQLRQLRSLHDGAEPRSHARFEIGAARAQALWANGAREEAIQVLEASIGEWREASGGLLPPADLDVLSTWASYLGDAGEFAAGEAMWRAEIERPYNEPQKRWLAIRLYEFLVRALRDGGRTAAGRGAELYRAARDEMRKALEEITDEGHARAIVVTLCSLFREAKEKKIDAAARDLADFAHRDVPAVLRLYQYRQGQDIVGNVAECIRRVSGPRDAVDFLVARAETEPSWLRRRNEDVWGAHAWRLSQWRHEAKDIGDLAPRLLAIVKQELKRDLADRDSRNRSMYWRHHPHFWGEKADEFLRAAQEVLETRRDSLEGVKYIAGYMADGLDRHGDAIDALLAFHRRHGLDERGQSQLVAYLQHSGRFEESIPLAAAMVDAWPGNVEYRVFLLRGYGKTGKADDLSAALAAADAYFHEGGRWSEHPAARLGWVCLDVGRFEAAAAYYGDAINFHTRSRSDRGSGDGTLSSYYGDQARAYAGLGRTKEAVDAAAGAIVSWGRNLENRKRATESLLAVLRDAKDLDGYVEAMEAEVAETRLENPTIRKALGKVFLERKEYAKAAHHLDAAVESGPVDAETARLLIEAYEKGGSPAKAAERLLVLARQSSHDFALWKELGERYAKLERAGEAERAHTTLAEMSANESEGRAMLAGIRAAQRRFADAAAEWRHVIRIRSKEPAGYLGLAESLIGAGESAQAREVLEDVLRKDWHPRFGDVHGEARKLIGRLPRS